MPAAIRTGCRPEADFLFLPRRIEGLEIIRLGIRLGEQAFEHRGIRFDAGKRQQRIEDREIDRPALGKAFPERGHHLKRLLDEIPRFFRLTGRSEFQEKRQEIRQFLGGRCEAAILIELDQVHHRLATIPALAMDMLEQVQRERTGPVEKQDVAFLRLDRVAGGERVDQAGQRLALRCRQPGLPFENRNEFRQGGQEIGIGIGQQCRENAKRFHLNRPPPSACRSSPSRRRTGWCCCRKAGSHRRTRSRIDRATRRHPP